ncbi:MAG: toll/interleukin-1 receptor domain-containing protein [Candidatus Humimicrobiia bacterium]
MTSIFLSHAEEDKDFANKLKKDLENKGIQVWLFEIHMLPGDELVKKIADSIKENDYLGVIITESSKNSEWVTLEVGMALALEHTLGYSKVIPILYGECDIPQFLNHKVYVDLYKDYEKGIEKIVKLLKEPPKKFESKFILPVSEESFDELQHSVNTVAEHFRLFKESREIELKKKLKYIN